LRDRFSLSKSGKIRHGFEFRHLYEVGRKAVGRFAVIYVIECQGSSGKHLVGFVASRKIGCAVERNRAKRLLREVYRLNRQRLKNNTQIIFIAQVAIRGRSFQEVEVDILSVFERAKIIRKLK